MILILISAYGLSADDSEEEDDRDKLGDGGDFFSDAPTVSTVALDVSVEAAWFALRVCLIRLSNPALGTEEPEDDDSTALVAPSSLTC